MADQIIPIIASFIFGILATVFTQYLIRNLSRDDKKRGLILGKINIIRDVLSDYENLFKCEYPELIEFVHAHDKLNPRAKYYDSKNPLKVYNALKEYFACRNILDNKEGLIDETLFYLVRKNVVRFRKKRRGITVNTMTYYYPDSDDNSLPSKISKIKHLDKKLFTEFPEKVAFPINFNDFKSIDDPQNINQIIRTKLRTKYDSWDKEKIVFTDSEWEQEIDLKDMMDFLWKYRREASDLIQEARVELNELESIWLPAS